MTVTPTIDVGSILMIITMLGSAVAIVVGVRVELADLKEAVGKLGIRLEKHEEVVFELAGQVQRIVGRLEATPRPHTTRTRLSDS